MQHLRNALIAATALALHASAQAWQIAEFYYLPHQNSLAGRAPLVNNPGVYTDAAPQDGRAYLVANNIAPPNGFVPLSPNYWSGAQWTGLEPADRSENSQKGLAPFGGMPSYGATVVQIDAHRVGMHLNTFGVTLPTGYSAASLQYRAIMQPGAGAIWQAGGGSQVCMSGQMNIASSYSGGATNQVMMTFAFAHPYANPQVEQPFFWFNVMMFDSRRSYSIRDWIHVDQQDTGAPIVISHAQSQVRPNPAVLYSSPVPGYGNPLTPMVTGNPTTGKRDYGFCISRAQFEKAVADINTRLTNDARAAGRTPRLLRTDTAYYRLTMALVGPEIETSTGRGHVGMSVDAMYVYRLRP